MRTLTVRSLALVIAILGLVIFVAYDVEASTSFGDRGAEVEDIQEVLADNGYTVKVDGIFGPQTLRAVRHFQKSSGLVTDGVVGPITGGALGLFQAVRIGNPVQTSPPPPPPAPAPGLYAPEGLSDCDEMNWYRRAVGLPEVFASLGWRESNCRNEDAVKTFCCHGYWQMYTSLHLRDHRLAPKMNNCGVYSHYDLNSDTPGDKRRQACAAKALYDTVGLTPWAL